MLNNLILSTALAFSTPAPSPTPAVSLGKIISMAEASGCQTLDWPGRGHSPKGFIPGVMLTYAKDVCKLQGGDSSAHVMGQAWGGNLDALTYYKKQFAAMGISDSPGQGNIQSIYLLGIGEAMRESSGSYCCGRDTTAGPETADEAEAGLFQTSWNAHSASPELPKLFAKYQQSSSGCFLDTFALGGTCSSSNVGSGDGATFQALSKSCPAFGVEFAMVTLRVLRNHYGPVNNYQVYLSQACNSLLGQVQQEILSNSAYCGLLN